ncbi:adenylate/guanylate cyclase domain-containing protein [Corynebacterium freiburgense]|uniref:adenylate/guanylate cyclase domain-containing protein n=1 Tax=Corynebacterium freiburgense TaxID=556548 RepID=UPI000400C121|nr:adenylate/guanylate cyclase domain-containing protein [Corynebacterium freiburgense]MDO4685863.1 adenylate/guanylate cyclase domain-containing protein [Corynebacterium sp.]WJZ02228.1 Adenylate and Guanylate cyclase catalytic domain protein [Corynebacterium freiburgense]
MEPEFKAHNFIHGAERMRMILDQTELEFPELDTLPTPNCLTFYKGVAARAVVVFADIRNSQDLPLVMDRTSLAKLYSAFVGEVMAVFSGEHHCQDVNVVGDNIWAVFRAPLREDIDRVFRCVKVAHSMVIILNRELQYRELSPIEVGFGIAWGDIIMNRPATLCRERNNVVYSGEVINRSAALAAQASATHADHPLMLDATIYENLNSEHQQWLTWNERTECWHGNVVDDYINAWTLVNYD